jgi:hypothetical protein
MERGLIHGSPWRAALETPASLESLCVIMCVI